MGKSSWRVGIKKKKHWQFIYWWFLSEPSPHQRLSLRTLKQANHAPAANSGWNWVRICRWIRGVSVEYPTSNQSCCRREQLTQRYTCFFLVFFLLLSFCLSTMTMNYSVNFKQQTKCNLMCCCRNPSSCLLENLTQNKLEEQKSCKTSPCRLKHSGTDRIIDWRDKDLRQLHRILLLMTN